VLRWFTVTQSPKSFSLSWLLLLTFEINPAKGGQFRVLHFASFHSFECIKIMALKLNFYNRKILVLTQILIEYPITITECRALVWKATKKISQQLSKVGFFLSHSLWSHWSVVSTTNGLIDRPSVFAVNVTMGHKSKIILSIAKKEKREEGGWNWKVDR